jgi:peptide/nickel transport system ATP-binding protein
MCKGRLVETAPKEALFKNPVHPYTKRLLAAVPEPDPNHRLDFSYLVEEKASNPELWPHPFTVDMQSSPVMMDIGDGHFVRVSKDTDAKELRL